MNDAALANLILFIHAGFVAFVILGLALTVAGLVLKWRWVRNFWFRSTHLMAIGFVVLQAWVRRICPLTTWESELRVRAGETPYPEKESFMAYWVHRLLFYEAEPWVFSLCYSIFGALVLITFLFGRPRWPSGRHATDA